MLTLIVTPSMLMVFTRDKRKPGQKGWFGRLRARFGRRSQESAKKLTPPLEPLAANESAPFPKAAE